MLVFICLVFFFKQKTAYEMRISDWSSDVCSSDLSLVARSVVVRSTLLARKPCRLFRCIHTVKTLSFFQIVKQLCTGAGTFQPLQLPDRKSVVKGKSVSVRVVPGGRRSIKKQTRVT